MGSNPVEASDIFLGFVCNCVTSQLRRSLFTSWYVSVKISLISHCMSFRITSCRVVGFILLCSYSSYVDGNFSRDFTLLSRPSPSRSQSFSTHQEGQVAVLRGASLRTGTVLPATKIPRLQRTTRIGTGPEHVRNTSENMVPEQTHENEEKASRISWTLREDVLPKQRGPRHVPTATRLPWIPAPTASSSSIFLLGSAACAV